MRWAGVIRPSGGASACVITPRWESEQAAPCPAPSAGLSPGPSPICPPTPRHATPPHPPWLMVAAARLWKPASGQLCDRDSKSSAHWLPAAAAAAAAVPGRGGAGGHAHSEPIGVHLNVGQNAQTAAMHAHCPILPRCSQGKSSFIPYFHSFVSCAAGKRQRGFSRNVIPGGGKWAGSRLLPPPTPTRQCYNDAMYLLEVMCFYRCKTCSKSL